MRTDREGDMGFMEAMVSMMVVAIALAMYIGATVGTVTVTSDPLDGFDIDSLGCEIADGCILVESDDYVDSYLSITGIKGLSVSISVPGDGSIRPETIVCGTMDTVSHSRSFSSVVDSDHGRAVVVIYEVSACA